MEKTYILGNNKAHAEHLGINFIEIPTITSDSDIHNWIESIFKQNEFDKLVIEIGNDVVLSLKIGYHIRLSINELKTKSLIPILFLSSLTLNSIILRSGIWGHILSTKGVYFSSLNEDINNVKLELSAIEGISTNEYRTHFWNIIKILPDETTGRHSLANIWGVYSMDKSANTNILRSDSDFIKNSTSLYFKYVSAINNLTSININTVGFINLGSSDIISSKEKKILLIDDEADKGWESVLPKIFNTTSADDFVVIKEKIKGYESFTKESKAIIENTPFDLYLIDLRLGGLEEDGTLNPEDISGMKVMRKIKSLNEGYQVIIFTASNKVWNMKALLDAGADGYYMKESPEFGFSKEFSEHNYKRFKQDVKRCFDRGFLKDIYLDIKSIKIQLNKIEDNSYRNELTNQIDLFWNMISKVNSEMDFAYAYVTLYMLIEIINSHFYKQTTDNKWEILNVGTLLNWQWDKEQSTYINTCEPVQGNKPPEWQKIAGLYFQKWEQTDHSFITNIYHLIQKRNGFVHGDKSILDLKNTKGQFLNRDIFKKDGIIKLMSAIKSLIYLLQ